MLYNTAMKILLVEDNEQLNKALSTVLKRNAFVVDSAFDGEEALLLLRDYSYDAIVLDIMLPRIDGLEVLKRARKSGIKTPILMLTAKSTVEDKILGLDLGADDYLAKPFGVAELRARVAALLRRVAVSSAPAPAKTRTFSVGSHTVDPKRSVVADEKGRETDLTSLELGLLTYLAAHRGEIVSRDNLLAGVWGNAYQGTNRTIDTRLAKLRQKLGADAALVETVYGTGYRLR